MQKREARLVRSLAAALSRDPNMPYQRLADATGVSRRTLYRFAASREALYERLRQEAVKANRSALAKANVEEGIFLDALASLTSDYLEDAELYRFWTSDTWSGTAGGSATSDSAREQRVYQERMSAFFARGQHDGCLKRDIPIPWLIECYDAMLAAAAASLRKGTVAPAGLSALVVATFLNGCAP